ncbi:MAG TPA: hypothetical protein DCZ91_16885 [Lachnospiraceae bacterium]|nr:hypothetical protein [Lachnospiraceae bacterium]
MYLNQVFELSMAIDKDKFHKVLEKACDRSDDMVKRGEEYIDQVLARKGITVLYRDSQYKKKVRVLLNLSMALDDETNVDKLIRKIDKWIAGYFENKYRLDDFILSGVVLTTDIDVKTHDNVLAYLKVLQRIGKVRGFSPAAYDCFQEDESFCLDGNSNGIQFLIYDLGNLIQRQIRKTTTDTKKMRPIAAGTQGILRAEVRLVKPKAVRGYTEATEVSGQIAELSKKCQDVFMDTFIHIIPFGDFYKKDKAVEIVRKEVKDITLRRKMLQLLTLIPEKKSLHLAQKAMNYRDIGKVMDMLAKIKVSPVTISKRQDEKYLKNIYAYI